MRVHALQLEAFGPFAKRAFINFDALSEAGIFLLNGETGAGKTSVLDGICYALYGSLPGVRTGSKSLRSDHAAPDALPEVICEFSTGGRRFEVTRSPAWERPSKRAKSGFTTEKAQSRLRERINGVWVEKSTRNDEVGHTLLGILGLDREQFTKVAMLPQGAFAAFLRASDKDREGLLRSLFDTSDYAMTERILNERATAARAEAEDAERARSTTLAQLVADASSTLYAESESESDENGDGGLPQAAREHLAAGESAELGELLRFEVRGTRSGLAQSRERADAQLAAAQKSHVALDERATRHRQLSELGNLRQAHESHAESIAALGALLEADARAVGLLPYHQQLVDARAKVQEAHRLLAAAAAAVQSGAANELLLAREPDIAGVLDAALDSEPETSVLESLAGHGSEAAKAARAAAALIEAALPEEEELEQVRGEVLVLGESLGSLTAQQRERAARIEVINAELPMLRERHAEFAALAESAAALEAAVLAATQRRDAVLERTQAEKAQATAHTAANTARTHTLDARERVNNLITLRLEQSAAVLAQELSDGQPCLVCGSTSHPEPANLPEGELVTTDGIEAARNLLAAAEKAEEKRNAVLKKAETALDLCRGKIGELSTAAAATELASATEAHDTALASGQQQSAAEEKLHSSEIELETLKAEASAAETERQVTAAKQEAQAARIVKLETRLAKLGRPGESLSERHVLLGAGASALEGLVSAVRTCLEAGRTENAAAKLWEQKLGEISVPDTAAWRALLLDDAQRTVHQREVRAHNDEAVRIKTLAEAPGIEAARLEAAAGIGAPDDAEHAAAAQVLAAATTARDAVLSRDAVLASYGQRLEEALHTLEVLARQAGPVLERYATLKGISELVRGAGENRLKMTLSTYVLAARLESVALAATQRLLMMTGQRYSLVHDDTPKGNNKSGLGLQVLDSWTQVKRDTQTLSGGESFMASLALALGLADVIQAQSGGIDIETLFVDEGFGSLDAETLEHVMDALEKLRSGGRVIGVVSHVAEMKQRIATQLNVHKSQFGSTVSMQIGV
ncbi:AAA family ATPase [Paeniglutamicibacter terrestris]|uniref:Nuclease SbcCD subunit C n=1 Tax=Paeniglutamicibacter terrestris TaxID=2723403 RepID=A0ABX1G2S4_9MICC|nr:AAA family ATPase [Paeniglutamicibacter terrestris]NKG20519.1 AAA family ATPase [Paeniglutamicibacter terrestris]